jgi:hypothetical protein
VTDPARRQREGALMNAAQAADRLAVAVADARLDEDFEFVVDLQPQN